MLETNCRIVRPGPDLYVWTRRAVVEGTDTSAELLELACGRLRHTKGLAAVPMPSSADWSGLLVATTEPIPRVSLDGEDWELTVFDGGEAAQRVALGDLDSRTIVPLLIERAFLVTLACHTNLWTLDSPRIWYEDVPFLQQDGIAVYRCYKVGALPLDGEGVGLSVDLGTAFFTAESLAYFFALTIGQAEQERRMRLFSQLTGRQEGQKGTLVYDYGRGRVKCYFEAACPGLTVAKTGKMRVKGQTYDSLYAYYRQTYPDLVIDPDGPVVRVSFRGLGRPQPVAAERVWARVMNDDVPSALSSIDKIAPRQRRDQLAAFWAGLGRRPLGRVAPGLCDGFWRPSPERVLRFVPPSLTFGKGQVLAAPAAPTAHEYRTHYRRRAEYLRTAGCYRVAATMPRTLHCAYPVGLDDAALQRLASDIVEALGRLSRLALTATRIEYRTVADAVAQLGSVADSGMALFVLNDEPAAYYDAAFGLPHWRIKRVTERTLRTQYDMLTTGVWDRKAQTYNLARGRARWDNFIMLNALDLLQTVDAIPYRIPKAGIYEAQLAIDVGHDRRYCALSLLIARDGAKAPDFSVVSLVQPKPDGQHEAINPVLLADQIVGAFEEALHGRFDALASVLVLRDGRLCGREIEGIDRAVDRLNSRGMLVPDALVDVVDLHKDTLKPLRVWEVDEDDPDKVENPLEGLAVILGDKTVLLTSTGVATLSQGTAEPLLISANGHCSSAIEATRATFDGAQLNWSSPTVAQRTPLVLKRTDDELTTRAAQEVRRLR